MRRRTAADRARHLTVYASAICLALVLGLGENGAAQRGEPGEGNRQGGAPAPGRGRCAMSGPVCYVPPVEDVVA